MFGIGSTELLVILVVALVVLGPKSLANISRTLGKAMGEFRRVSTDFQRTLNAEAAQEEEAERRKQAVKKTAGATDETVAVKPAQTPETPAARAVSDTSDTVASQTETATEALAAPTPSVACEASASSPADGAPASDAPASPPAGSPLAAALAKTRAEAEALSPQNGATAPATENGGAA
ncbi:Sec-independent protein translocase protein TatB [Desulfovibrio sp. SGI.169]|uniref:Sec-independent protein translocase protein TatB n=1 Tax=Desulfovibrio sp. SGI.169 TaxID=3420561 RepID=UPI003CFFBE1F